MVGAAPGPESRGMHYALYIASALGAVALFLMMPRRGYNPRKLGALLGALVLGGLWLHLWRHLSHTLGVDSIAFVYYYVFSGLAIASAVRVITHTKPVYAALWFVMVVLASSGLLLVLEAEFMAFAVVIIYGGAILVTYLFVIMLAAQAADPKDPTQTPDLDAVAYEPVAAISAGFLLLAVILTALFEPTQPNPAAQGPSDQQVIATVLTNRPHQRLARHVAGQEASNRLPVAMTAPDHLSNVERVGLDLFRSHPLALELAGVILLVALVGAVVIARVRVDPLLNAANAIT